MTTRPSFTPLGAADFAAAFPASRKIYVDGPAGVRVPMREIVLSNGETLRVYDASGRLVRTLFEADMSAGVHRARWDGRDASDRKVGSGIYFFQLAANGATSTSRILLLR